MYRPIKIEFVVFNMSMDTAQRIWKHFAFILENLFGYDVTGAVSMLQDDEMKEE